MTFSVIDGCEELLFDVVLTCLKDIGKFDRLEWKFEGILWDRETHFKLEADGRKTRAQVKGEYNVRKRSGTLYVLAFEQPKPLIEVISWDEVIDRLKRKHYAFIGHTSQTEDLVEKGFAIDMQRIDEHLLIFRCTLQFSLPSEAASFNINTENGAPPLELNDGRILFTAANYEWVLYPRKE
ncbi:hypothetical protein EXS57_02230 [Candidatus Kaiserbacteria bacterium]|nr:hypothetical protein [Candidatus Kaiserbacteria bacterium]